MSLPIKGTVLSRKSWSVLEFWRSVWYSRVVKMFTACRGYGQAHDKCRAKVAAGRFCGNKDMRKGRTRYSGYLCCMVSLAQGIRRTGAFGSCKKMKAQAELEEEDPFPCDEALPLKLIGLRVKVKRHGKEER